MNSPRYQGKPLLRPLECFVLKAIGELSAEGSGNMNRMESGLAHAFGKVGTWDQIIAETMSFPEDMPARIREVWDRNLAIAREQEVTLSSQHFAEKFVDQNLI